MERIINMNTNFMKSGIVVPILTPIDKEEKINETKLRYERPGGLRDRGWS